MCCFSDQVEVFGIDLFAEQFALGSASIFLRMTKLQVFLMWFQPAGVSPCVDAAA